MKTSGSVGGAKESLGDVVEQVSHSLIDACAVGLAAHSRQWEGLDHVVPTKADKADMVVKANVKGSP